jgi:hypothetical protein
MSSDILNAMLRKKLRDIAALVLTATLAVGLVAHSVGMPTAAGAQMMTAAAGDMPMSGKCSDCVDDQRTMAAACAAYCNTVAVLPVAAVVFDLIAMDILRPHVSPTATGLTVPPDPYPPRPIGMN